MNGRLFYTIITSFLFGLGISLMLLGLGFGIYVCYAELYMKQPESIVEVAYYNAEIKALWRLTHLGLADIITGAIFLLIRFVIILGFKPKKIKRKKGKK